MSGDRHHRRKAECTEIVTGLRRIVMGPRLIDKSLGQRCYRAATRESRGGENESVHVLVRRFSALVLCPKDRIVLADILRVKYVFFYDEFNVISYNITIKYNN